MEFNPKQDHIKNYNAVLQSDGLWLHSDKDRYSYNEEGQVHCDFGPAIVSSHFMKLFWYLDGREYNTFEEWLINVNVSDEKKMMLRLQYE